MFCQVLFHLFLVKFILVIIIFGTMAIVLMKEGRLVVAMDDLDFKIKDVAFETKMFNRYGTFD